MLLLQNSPKIIGLENFLKQKSINNCKKNKIRNTIFNEAKIFCTVFFIALGNKQKFILEWWLKIYGVFDFIKYAFSAFTVGIQ